MLFTSSMVTTLVIISMLQPVAHHSILIPALLGKVVALKYALMVVPKVAIGAVLFGEGAAVIGGHLLWKYLEWKRNHRYTRHRHPFFGGWSGAKAVPSGWGGTVKSQGAWKPWLHERYNAAYHKGHRAIDVLAWGLDKAQWAGAFGAERLQDFIGDKASKALYLAAELAKPSYGWPAVGHGQGQLHKQAAPFIHELQHPTIIKTVGVEPGPAYHHGPPPSQHGHYIEHDELGGSHSYTPTETVPYEPTASPPLYEDDGESHVYSSHGGSEGNYGGRDFHSSEIGPEYLKSSGSSSSPYQSEPLDREEFLKLMDWAGSSSRAQSEEYNPEESASEIKFERFGGTEPLDSSEVQPPRVIRIKRKTDDILTKHEKPEDDTFIKYLVEDVRRFFTVVTYLDENKCLQKLVCDVHSKAKSLAPEDESKVTVYETHILSAFKILETFMPPYEDSSTNYRVAARLGMNAPTDNFCATYFDSCTYTAQDIIGFNDKIESNQIEKIPTTNKDLSSSASESVVAVAESPKAANIMPQV